LTERGTVNGMNFKKLTDQAKAAIDKRGGTEALKGDLAGLKNVAKGKGTFKEKAQAAKDSLNKPGSTPAAGDTPPTASGVPPTAQTQPPTARDLPPRG
jgi:hypothetical protein